ncbi:MAG: helix-turn-helix domain-containing protein [Clostridia bacterium]|nr:helix-turn-helix domain-containing protein [Clostridia bacterium]MCR5040507.1 helix-turn-helix domain-containing protein [Clostridia bacterium]
MRYKSSEKMKEIVRAIEDLRLRADREPTVAQIAAEVGLAPSSVHAYLHEMEEKGIVSYRGRRPETGRTRLFDGETSVAAVVGSVKCGDPELEEAEVLGYVRLPQSIFGKKNFYILHARGDSMEDAGINDGDVIVVENTPEAGRGDIVVAMTGDGENTLKRFEGLDAKSGRAVLRFENEAVYPGKTIEVDRLMIQGVCRFVIKAV